MMLTTSQILHDGGPRNVVMQFTGISDGVGAETNVVKVDASALAAKSLKITKINYDVNGGILRLLWDAADPVEFLDLIGFGEINYRMIGGMVNSAGDGTTGNILFSTLGFEAGSSYNITIEMKKKQKL